MKPAETPDPKESPAVGRVDRRGGVMRNHRVALVVSGVAASAAALMLIIPGAAAPLQTENTSWSPPASPQRTMLLSSQDLEPLAAFASAVEAWQFSTYVSAEHAAALAAESPATTPTAPNTAPTYQPTSSIWACIVQHESGGNPTVYNESGSGASGLVQFMPGTWGGYDGYANAADAPASVQMERAYQVEAEEGWSPWVGDGCTPLG